MRKTPKRRRADANRQRKFYLSYYEELCSFLERECPNPPQTMTALKDLCQKAETTLRNVPCGEQAIQDAKQAALKTPPLVPLGDIGHLMDLKEFGECVADRMFIDYDGFGYYATTAGMDNKHRVFPSDFQRDGSPLWATHIMWFNR